MKCEQRWPAAPLCMILIMTLGLCSHTHSVHAQNKKKPHSFVNTLPVSGSTARSQSQHAMFLTMPTSFEDTEPIDVTTDIAMLTRFTVEVLKVDNGAPAKIQIDCKDAFNYSLTSGPSPMRNLENAAYNMLKGKSLILEKMGDKIGATPLNLKAGDPPYWAPLKARFTHHCQPQAWFPSAATLFAERKLRVGDVVELDRKAVQEFFELPARVGKCKTGTFRATLDCIEIRNGTKCGVFKIDIAAFNARTGRASDPKRSSSMDLECNGWMIVGCDDLFLYDVDLNVSLSAWANGMAKPKSLYGCAKIKISHAQLKSSQQFDSVSLTERNWQSEKRANQNRSKSGTPKKVSPPFWIKQITVLDENDEPYRWEYGTLDIHYWVGDKKSTRTCQVNCGRVQIPKQECQRITFSNIRLGRRDAEYVSAKILDAESIPKELKFEWASAR